jgi:hypothetical protein
VHSAKGGRKENEDGSVLPVGSVNGHVLCL